MFGGGRRGPMRGSDVLVKISLSFKEAVFGCDKDIDVERVEECDRCKGSGAEPDTKIIKCPVCHGTGIERKLRKTIIGTIATQNTCSNCKGQREVPEKPCKVCGGIGRTRNRAKIKVKIPAGIDTGNHLRLREQGNEGDVGAGKGDVIVVVYVEPHEVFKRDGTDIYMEVPISFSEAALGSKIEVPTLKGNAEIKITAGTQTGTIFRMKDKGIVEINGRGHGDQFVKVIVKTPEKLTKKQKELFEELGENEELAKKREGFIDKLKKKFK